MTPIALIGAGVLAIMMLVAGIWSLTRPVDGNRNRLKRRLKQYAAANLTAAATTDRLLSKVAPNTGWAAKASLWLQRIVAYDSAVPNRPIPIWLACVIALLIARVLVWLATSLLGPLGWFIFPFAVLWLIRSYFGWCTRRWRDALFKQFPDALSTIVRTVRVGVSLADGMRRVADEAPEPTAAVFATINSALAIGTSLTDAMAVVTARTGVPEYRFFTTALVLQSRTGGGLAATLEGLADVIRRRVMVRARGKALAGEARASAAVLALLPILTIGGMLVLNPDYMTQLFVSSTGHTLLSAAVVSEGLGIIVMRTMIVKSLS